MTLIVSYDPSLGLTISENIVVTYFSVVSFVAVAYDWILTLGQEVELVWRQHWSLMTVLYLGVRYIGMLFLLFAIFTDLPSFSMTDLDCIIFSFAEGWMFPLLNVMLCIIMIARLYAMYQQSRKILIFLVVTCLSLTIASVILSIMDQGYSIAEEVVISSTIHICTSLGANFVGFRSITLMLDTVWEVLALCLSIWIVVKHFKELQRPSTGWAIRDCFRILVKTHMFYFTTFAMVACFNLGTLSPTIYSSIFAGSNPYFGFLQFAAAIQMFVLGPRLILGIREYHANHITNNDAGTEMNSIIFQERVHITTGSVV